MSESAFYDRATEQIMNAIKPLSSDERRRLYNWLVRDIQQCITFDENEEYPWVGHRERIMVSIRFELQDSDTFKDHPQRNWFRNYFQPVLDRDFDLTEDDAGELLTAIGEVLDRSEP